MKRTLSLLGALCAITLSVLGGTPAYAASAPQNVRPAITDLTVGYYGRVLGPNGEFVDIYWGFAYSSAANQLAAYGEMDPSDGAIHTQAQPLNLGDNNGVLESATFNSQSYGFALETGAVSCHKPNGLYNSNLHYSIRWSNSQVTTGQTGDYPEHRASVICI
jgi:hypothetical protein